MAMKNFRARGKGQVAGRGGGKNENPPALDMLLDANNISCARGLVDVARRMHESFFGPFRKPGLPVGNGPCSLFSIFSSFFNSVS